MRQSSGLNPSQRAAVEHGEGPLLVLAGAGSGKTRVITHRIARLVGSGVAPEAVLAVSFTNKAAAEMAERMVPLLGGVRAQRIAMSTFHSFGVRLLGEETEALGYPGRFVIFDQGDSMGVVRDVLRTLRKASGSRRLDAAAVLARISMWKNQFLEPSEVQETDVEYDAIAREVYPRYEARLRAMCAVDFDDLVLRTVEVLREHVAVRAKWRDRFDHLLVDEFQDTNRAQLELVKLLCNDRRNLCVVGDDDQAIYGWRGAEVKNILEFDRTFPGARIIKLEDNYRSRAPILSIANAAIALSTGARHGKVLRAARGRGDRVRLCVADCPEDEARLVAEEIAELGRAGSQPRDIAVLYRSNLQARAVEEQLRAGGVPYRLFGGTQFFDRKEVKDVAAYLRVLCYPRDEISLRRILNTPPRGIGDATVERIERHARRHRMPFVDTVARIAQVEGVPDNAVRGAAAFFAVLERARARSHAGQLASAARQIICDIGFREALADDPEEGASAARRWENVEFLLRSLERYEQRQDVQKPSLGTFLNRITLHVESDQSEEDLRNVVTLSTLHAAKGLEFPVVFLIGCVEGQLPHNRASDPKATDAAPVDPEEERRLFYVGVTRARDRLYLTRPKAKVLRGKPVPLAPSRFLDGLPAEDIELQERSDSAPLQAEEMASRMRSFLDKLRP